MPESRSSIPGESLCISQEGNILSKLKKMMQADEIISRKTRNQEHGDPALREIREPEVLVSAHMRTLSSFLRAFEMNKKIYCYRCLPVWV